jgi:hypothetical protein
MVRLDSKVSDTYPEAINPNAIVLHLRQEITGGRHWYLAFLHAVGKWEIIEETINRRSFRYLISGEAFDLLLLAERLCETIDSLIPDAEKNDLLFYNKPPLEITTEEFKTLIGDRKYHQHLNFYYGIIVEEALLYAVEEEIRKERRSTGLYRDKDNTGEAYRRIYGFSKVMMLRNFRKEKGYSQTRSIRLDEIKEFTYWLFKHRLKQSDKARVASDTRKGLDWLMNKGAARHTNIHSSEIETIDILSH